MNTKSEATAGGSNPAKDDSLSEEAMIALLTGESDEGQETEEPEIPEEETEEESAEETESEEDEETEEDESEGDAEGVEGIDLASLTDEQWEIVRTKLKSRAAADIQALKRENRAKDETISALQSQHQQQPIAPAEPVTSRFLEGIETAEQLAGKAGELKKLAKDIDTILDDHEDYGPSDPIQVGEQTFTKKQLRALGREVREALTEAVPSKQAEITRQAESVQLLEKAKAEAVSRVPALADENSEVSKNFRTLLESPNFKRAYEVAPELRPMLHLLGAMAVEKYFDKPAAKPAKTQPATGKVLKAKPPAPPAGAAAVPRATPGSSKQKDSQAKTARFFETGSEDDLVAALAARDSS